MCVDEFQIYGLDSYTGRIVWQNLLPEVEPFVKEEHSRSETRVKDMSMPLFVQRTTAHFPHQPVCTVLCRVKVSACAGAVHVQSNFELSTFIFYLTNCLFVPIDFIFVVVVSSFELQRSGFGYLAWMKCRI